MLNFDKKYKYKKNVENIEQLTSSKANACVIHNPFCINKEIDVNTTIGIALGEVIKTGLEKKGLIVNQWYAYCFDQNKYNGSWKNCFQNHKKEILRNEKILERLSSGNSFFLKQYDPSFTIWLRKTFKDLVKKGSLKKEYDIVYWSLKNQILVPQEQIMYETKQIPYYGIKYFVSTKNHSLDVYTHSPESIFADVAIAISPYHKKAKALKGTEAIIPIINKKIPIIIDPRVDLYKHQGVLRITPGHDLLSFEIAKEHNLPLNEYAFTRQGLFTKHAGDFYNKPVSEFLENVVQSLDDIGNLIGKEKKEFDVATHKETGEKLVSFSSQEWFFYPSEEIRGELENIPSKRCISTASYDGIRIPATSGDKIMDEETIVVDAKKEKNPLLFTIIASLVYDGYLSYEFSFDDVIENIVMIFDNEETLGQQYIKAYQNNFPELAKKYQSEMKDFFNLLQKKKSEYREEAIKQILQDMEKNSILKKNGLTYIWQDIQDCPRIFEESFVQLMMMTAIIEQEYESNPKQIQKFLIGSKKNIPMMQKSVGVFQTIHHDKDMIIDIVDHEEIMYIKPQHTKIKEYMDEFGNDALKGSMVPLFFSSKERERENVEEEFQLINNFWNACRYVELIKTENKQTKDIKKIVKNIIHQQDNLDVFDSWIVFKLKLLIEEYQSNYEKRNFIECKNILNSFIKNDFSKKYLEISKYTKSSYTKEISLFVIYVMGEYLEVYWSDVVKSIFSHIGYEKNIDTINEFVKIDWKKNYTINLIMDIIDRFSSKKNEMNVKKHEKIDVAIKANPDFLRNIKSYEELIKIVVNIQDFEYIQQNQYMPKEYDSEEIIDIVVGVKLPSKKIINPTKELENQRKEKEEYLQYMKTTLSDMQAGGLAKEVIQERKEEIEKVKNEIEEIEYLINKSKIKE